MPKHELEIGLNFKEGKQQSKQAINDINREFKNVKPVEFLTRDSKKLFDGTYLRTIQTMRKELNGLYSEANRLAQIAKTRPLTAAESRIAGGLPEQITQAREGLMGVQAERAALTGSGGIRSALTGIAGRFGMGRAASLLAGGGASLGAVASATGVGALVAYAFRAMGGYGKYKEAVPEYTRLLGMGYNPSYSTMMGAAGLGFGPQQTRALMGQILTGSGTMNTGAMTQIMKTSRAYGLDASMLGQFPGLFTKLGGTNNLVKQQAEVFAGAINTRLERGRLGEYLEAVASTMERFADTSPGASAGGISSMMSMLSKGGGVLTPAVAGGMLGGLNDILRNPQGGFGMMMMGAGADVLRRGGYKRGMVEGLYRMTKESMFVPRPDELSTKYPYTYLMGRGAPLTEFSQAFHGGGGTMGLLSGFRKQLGSMGGGADISDLILAGAPGFKSAGAAREFLAKMEHAELTGNKQKQGELEKEFEMNMEKNLTDINQSLVGKEGILGALDDLNSEIVGQHVGYAIQDLKDALLNIEAGLMPLLELMKLNPISLSNRAGDWVSEKLGLPTKQQRMGEMRQFTSRAVGTGAGGGEIFGVGQGGEGAGGFLGSGLTEIGSSFGKLRNIGTSPHIGVDWKTGKGTKLKYNVPYKVSRVWGDNVEMVDAYGNKIITRHLGNTNVQAGQQLQPGQVFGSSGQTWPHTEVYNPSGQLIDPLIYNQFVKSLGDSFGKAMGILGGQKVYPQNMNNTGN